MNLLLGGNGLSPSRLREGLGEGRMLALPAKTKDLLRKSKFFPRPSRKREGGAINWGYDLSLQRAFLHRRQFPDTFARQFQKRMELLFGERCVFGGSLNLHNAACACKHEIRIGLRV